MSLVRSQLCPLCRQGSDQQRKGSPQRSAGTPCCVHVSPGSQTGSHGFGSLGLWVVLLRDVGEDVVHGLRSLVDHWADLLPVDDLCRDGAAVAHQGSDVLARQTVIREQRDEGRASLPRRAVLGILDPCIPPRAFGSRGASSSPRAVRRPVWRRQEPRGSIPGPGGRSSPAAEPGTVAELRPRISAAPACACSTSSSSPRRQTERRTSRHGHRSSKSSGDKSGGGERPSTTASGR